VTVRERQASVRARRKKRGRRLMIAYALRSVIFLLLALMIVLMVCGVLYIRDHLAPDSKLPDGNMEPDDPALSEPPIVPIEPAIPGEITIPDWIVQDILPVNEYSRPGIALSEVNGVVVHYTGNPGTTAEQNRSYYKNLAETKETYASSHFVIGMDGKIIQCVPLDEIAYCSNQRNDDTISIECCHSDDTGQFSQDTLDALLQLLNWLIKTYELSRDDILRHYDVIGKECPYYFVKHPGAWEGLLNSLTYDSVF
jgi:N-acetylmuramoyl-L-alanine amidase